MTSVSLHLFSHIHQCRKGIWPQLILTFCSNSRTKTYKTEAKKGQHLASGMRIEAETQLVAF